VDWPGLVRKYVWDEEKTPYLVRADRLTPAQARSEIFVYAFLLVILAAAVTLIGVLGRSRGGALTSPAVALYAVTVLVAAVSLWMTGQPAAAVYTATAPLAMGAGALAGLLRPDMAGGERLVVAAVSGLWLGYAARIVRVARRLHGRE
jgi:peptidoglycan/LPS O-acetylase OafA/YrhL